jgi:hypothetical protein
MSWELTGLYELYWFFKNWQIVAQRTGSGRYVVPAIQVFFSYFLCYSLFKRIGRAGLEAKVRPLSPGWLAISWVALHLAQRLPDPYWLISITSVVPLLFVQATVNDINAALTPDCHPNSRFSLWNLLACLLGGAVVTFGMVDTFAPDLLED